MSRFVTIDAATYFSTPDAPELRVTGPDLALKAKVAAADYTPTSSQQLIGKWNTVGDKRAYAMWVETSGRLRLYTSADGSAVSGKLSTVVIPASDGEVVTLEAVNDIAANEAKFYVDGVQLGSTATAALEDGSPTDAPVTVGANGNGGGNRFVGDVFWAEVRASQLLARFDADDIYEQIVAV